MEITVPVKDITEKLTLRTHVGSGSYGDVPIELATSIPESSPVVKVGDKIYLVSMHDIAKAVANLVIDD